MLGKELPKFDQPDGKRVINQCFFAVSVDRKERAAALDNRVRAALNQYLKEVPGGKEHKWPSRAGLNQSLRYHGTTVMADIRRHVVVHLVERIIKYATVKLTHILETTLPSDTTLEKDVVKKLAQRLTKTLIYNEKQAYAIAKAKGEDPPPIPAWTKPRDVYEILDLPKDSNNQHHKQLLSVLSEQPEVAVAVEEVFNIIRHHTERYDALPICSSKAADKYNEKGKDNPWLRRYYPLHRFMLGDLENMGGQENGDEEGSDLTESKVIDKPVRHVHWAWALRKVVKICGRHPDVYVSRRSKRRATQALLKAINNRSSVRTNSKGESH